MKRTLSDELDDFAEEWADLKAVLADELLDLLVSIEDVLAWRPKTYAERLALVDAHMAQAHRLGQRRKALVVAYSANIVAFREAMRRMSIPLAEAARRMEAAAKLISPTRRPDPSPPTT